MRVTSGIRPFLCIYLDSTGEPVVITEVSEKMLGPLAYAPDMICLDTVEHPVCIVASGHLQPSGKDFCERKSLPATAEAVLDYIDKGNTSCAVRKDFKVGKPLHLKRLCR